MTANTIGAYCVLCDNTHLTGENCAEARDRRVRDMKVPEGGEARAGIGKPAAQPGAMAEALPQQGNGDWVSGRHFSELQKQFEEVRDINQRLQRRLSLVEEGRAAAIDTCRAMDERAQQTAAALQRTRVTLRSALQLIEDLRRFLPAEAQPGTISAHESEARDRNLRGESVNVPGDNRRDTLKAPRLG